MTIEKDEILSKDGLRLFKLGASDLIFSSWRKDHETGGFYHFTKNKLTGKVEKIFIKLFVQ